LLQCLVLDGKDLPPATQVALAPVLLDAGAPMDEPFIATGSAGNLVLAEFLLDRGARLDPDPGATRAWTVLEEALYWGFADLAALLLRRGAAIGNPRTAAGLGRVAAMERFFTPDGSLRLPAAGVINWPFGKLPPEQQSSAPQDLLDHALAYAAMGGHADAAEFLLARGAAINALPLGFDYRGSALHWAAIRGRKPMCALLLARGADPALRDLKVGQTPADWARHGDHASLAQWLAGREAS
jgi:hypothetical protein